MAKRSKLLEGKDMCIEHYERLYFESVGVYSSIIPYPSEWALVMLYFAEINTLLPLIDQETFQQQYRQRKASPHLIKAICLVTLRLSSAASYIRGSSDGCVIHDDHADKRNVCRAQESLKEGARSSAATLARRLYTALRAAVIEGNLEPDRVDRIRILALMSLVMPLTHAESSGTHHLSRYLHQAVCEAQSLGLHLGSTSTKASDTFLQKNVSVRKASRAESRLWWSLYVLDRLGTFNDSRKPHYIQDRDIGMQRRKLMIESGFLRQDDQHTLALWIDQVDIITQLRESQTTGKSILDENQLRASNGGDTVEIGKTSYRDSNISQAAMPNSSVFNSTSSIAVSGTHMR
ncbi:hypothetical protein Z517_12552 [Fonsecaea pedrosoi CBS 271.37]|uniref:Xylanolytic transcriptional activator regulatory domain-containing protein n=1 Tax=Fonsecaea pedrosoi CBS 271.37 TaxID=1442368 RepID=A0A0D2EIF7_9EURO|nr:uncharacterized protein Z517_12552 [Fonsecaea pedrosoi CBS 271.37]KIW74142.1 hypothetical protein Z517_12552 [Fonsecaea pedrosoi CBS 271.37]